MASLGTSINWCVVPLVHMQVSARSVNMEQTPVKSLLMHIVQMY